MNRPDTHQSSASAGEVCVRGAVDGDREAALRMLCEGFVPHLTDASGVMVATRNESIVAAGWLQFLSHEVGAVWLPTSIGGDLEAEDLLGVALDRACAASSFRVIRTLLAPDSGKRRSNLAQRIGLTKRTRLASLYCALSQSDSRLESGKQPEYVQGGLRFHSVDPLDATALESFSKLTQLTYDGSLDCPELTAEISAGAILDGYLRHGEPDSRRWFRVTTDSDAADDVGVLVLYNDEEDEQMELLYLGISPPFRGCGYGGQVVEFAKSYGSECGSRRMTLAVDTRNEPAMTIYRGASMARYAEHDLYARVSNLAQG